MEWDYNTVSGHFHYLAKEADRYLKDLKEKVTHDPLFRRVHDEALARRDVYEHLYAKPFLYSREGLLTELQAMIESGRKPALSSFDGELYLRTWRLEVEEIMRQFSSYEE